MGGRTSHFRFKSTDAKPSDRMDAGSAYLRGFSEALPPTGVCVPPITLRPRSRRNVTTGRKEIRYNLGWAISPPLRVQEYDARAVGFWRKWKSSPHLAAGPYKIRMKAKVPLPPTAGIRLAHLQTFPETCCDSLVLPYRMVCVFQHRKTDLRCKAGLQASTGVRATVIERGCYEIEGSRPQ